MSLEAVLYGAVTRGTNKATLLLINLCLLGCVFVCATLIFLPLGLPEQLVPHIVGLLLLAIALQLSINWLVAETGTVSEEEQRRELFGAPGREQLAAEERQVAEPQVQQEPSAAAAAGSKPKEH